MSGDTNTTDLTADNGRLRSFYLQQAPAEVQTSLHWLHRQADLSPDQRDKRHTDRVLTYLAEVMRVASELRMFVEMAGLADDEEGNDA